MIVDLAFCRSSNILTGHRGLCRWFHHFPTAAGPQFSMLLKGGRDQPHLSPLGLYPRGLPGGKAPPPPPATALIQPVSQ